MRCVIYLRHLHQPYVSSPICQEHMLEGGQSDPKCMLFIVQSGAYACFSFGHLACIMGDLEEGRVLTVVLFPHLKWGLIFNSSPVGPPLMAHGFKKGTTWEILTKIAWSCSPHFILTTSLRTLRALYPITHYLWVISLAKKILQGGLKPAANNPLQPPDSSMCHYLRHLSQPCGPSAIYYGRMFEGGSLNPKGMIFHSFS